MSKRNITPKVPGQPAADAAQPAAAVEPAGDADALDGLKAPSPAPAADALPDQDDIDRNTITRPVLSKQGWVLPIEKPGPQFAKG